MRTHLASMTLVCVTLGTVGAQAATTLSLPQPFPRTAILQPAPQAEKESAVRDETPNQRRRRLGQEITASYPPPEYGEALETPNQRRHRLGQPIVASYETQVSGVAEETPNHRRERIAQTLP
jgi:hypothetical protein